MVSKGVATVSAMKEGVVFLGNFGPQKRGLPTAAARPQGGLCPVIHHRPIALLIRGVSVNRVITGSQTVRESWVHTVVCRSVPVCVYSHMYTQVCFCMHVCVWVCMHACVHACACTRV